MLFENCQQQTTAEADRMSISLLRASSGSKRAHAQHLLKLATTGLPLMPGCASNTMAFKSCAQLSLAAPVRLLQQML